MRYLIATVVALLLATTIVQAADIVTMPTANQLSKNQADLAAYYLKLDVPAGAPAGAPQSVWYQTAYFGITDEIELDVHYADVDNDKQSVVLVASYRLLSENLEQPDLVVGVRNLAGTATTNGPVKEDSKERSYFVAGTKTFFLNPERPGPPLVRAHLALGTKDWTLLGEKRHEGIFGGLQFLFRPTLGAIILHDGQDLITGITFMPKDTALTIKAGTYGDHQWYGIAYAYELPRR